MDNDYVMGFKPSKESTPYKKAYEKWKNELEQLLKNS